MKVVYANARVEKLCTNRKALQRYNVEIVDKLASVLQMIESAKDFKDIYHYRPIRLHPLEGKRNGQYAADLGKKTGMRLIIQLLDDNDHVILERDIQTITTLCVKINIKEVSKHYE